MADRRRAFQSVSRRYGRGGREVPRRNAEKSRVWVFPTAIDLSDMGILQQSRSRIIRDIRNEKGPMPSALRNNLIRVLGSVFSLYLIAHAQCPVDTVIVKGRVEHPIAQTDYRVRVQLVYPKHKPGEAGEVTVEDAKFQIPVEFVTSQSSAFTNLPKRCGRKPQTVVITLLSGDQKSDEASLDFARNFRMVDASAYTLRSELALNGGSQ